MAAGSKANHLAYLGATVGERVNYGAVVLLQLRWRQQSTATRIEADVHIGSKCVGGPSHYWAGGTVGAGSVISRDTPVNALVWARKLTQKEGWQRPAQENVTPDRISLM